MDNISNCGEGVLSTNDLWVMSGINIGLAVVSIGLFGMMIREKVRPMPELPSMPFTVEPSRVSPAESGD